MTKVGTKECYKCYEQNEILYHCRYKGIKDWVFLCGKCFKEVKNLFEYSYQYGGS